MKIVAIMGSPRRNGAGFGIVSTLEARMKAMGDVEFAYVFLSDTNLEPCLGCYSCMAKGEDKCPRKDDRATIEQQLLAADGIVLSSPVHVNNVSWLMKNFIDRFAYTNHRPRFHRQKVLTVVNMAGTGGKGVLSSNRLSLGGARLVHELALATPPWPQTARGGGRAPNAQGRTLPWLADPRVPVRDVHAMLRPSIRALRWKSVSPGTTDSSAPTPCCTSSVVVGREPFGWRRT